MATLLHLTDLHLEAPDDYGGGDVKSGALPPDHQPSRTNAIRNTLEALAASDRIPAFDVVVITGDIAWRDERAGWEKFESVLQPLRDAAKFPDDDHIIITPGNHDVRWRLAVDDPDHYEHFEEFVRSKRYITPLLDRKEIDEDGDLVTADPTRHFLFDATLGLAVVPLNTSHYCGVYEPLKGFDDASLAAMLSPLGSTDAQRMRDELDAHRLFDIPRVSEQQLQAIARLLRHLQEALRAAGADSRDILRIAATHHHTLPISTHEEFKAFESLTNLGQVRQFLADRDFRLLLHGHKHSGGVYWDRIHRAGEPLSARDWNLLVVSGSTLGSPQQGQEELARILEVLPGRRERAVAITRVPLVPLGGPVPDSLKSDRAELWRAEMEAAPTAQLISGTAADDVYQRVQALFAGLDENAAIANLVCEIGGPAGAERLPTGYPDEVPGETVSERQEWFTEMVEWWQRTHTRLIEQLHFTHGQRLRRYGEDEVDQLDEAVQLLQNDPTSTRAVMTLIDPRVDRLPTTGLPTDRKFPSFSLNHLSIRPTPAGVHYLDCLGFFRKQEMRFWWPINVAELQRIQAEVLKRLSRADLRAGSIITYAAFAHVGAGVPDVNVTAVDRLADDDERMLWDMAYLLAHPEEVDADAARANWVRVLDDLEPKDHAPPRPLLGLSLLLESLSWFSRGSASGPTGEVHARLRDLENAYAALAAGGGDPMYWREKILETLAAIRTAVETPAPSESTGTIQ